MKTKNKKLIEKRQKSIQYKIDTSQLSFFYHHLSVYTSVHSDSDMYFEIHWSPTYHQF